MFALAKPFLLPSAAAACAGALLLGACADQAPPTEPSLERPAFGAVPQASGAGALVIRNDREAAALMFDFDRDLTVVVGQTPAELEEFCQTFVFTQPWTELDVSRPNGALHIISRSEVITALVYQGVAFDPCLELVGVTPLAEGTARARYIDNDFFLDGPGGESFGLVVQGKVTEVGTGRLLTLNAYFRAVIRPDGTVDTPSSDVLLRPIGR
jgi:hypothetical protein